MLRFKSGVSIRGVQPETLVGLRIAEQAYESIGKDCTVTSCSDGKHKTGSLHYSGLAVDLRTKILSKTQVATVMSYLTSWLPAGFDVIFEGDHIHMEYDPKDGE